MPWKLKSIQRASLSRYSPLKLLSPHFYQLSTPWCQSKVISCTTEVRIRPYKMHLNPSSSTLSCSFFPSHCILIPVGHSWKFRKKLIVMISNLFYYSIDHMRLLATAMTVFVKFWHLISWWLIKNRLKSQRPFYQCFLFELPLLSEFKLNSWKLYNLVSHRYILPVDPWIWDWEDCQATSNKMDNSGSVIV